MADDNSDYSDLISRRRFVELTGVAGAGALAGCGGGGGGGTTTEASGGDGSTPSDGGTPTPTDSMGGGTTPGQDGGTPEPTATDTAQEYPKQRHIGVTTKNPNKVQFNQLNSTQLPEISNRLMYEKYAQYNYIDGGYNPMAMKSWEFTGDKFTMTLRDDLMWTNGDPVTTDDIMTQMQLLKKTGDPMFNWAGDVSADGQTITVSVKSKVNPSLVETDVLRRWIDMPDSVYGKFTDQPAEKVENFKGPGKVTNGPFKLSDRNESLMLLKQFEDSPYADNINFGEYAFQVMGGNQARKQALLNLDIDSDYSLTVQAQTVANFPDAIEEVKIPNVFGIGLAPNFNHRYAGDRAVRKAIQHVINRQLCVANSYARVKVAPDIPTGVPTAYQDDWLGDIKGDYMTYGKAKSQTGKAASILRNAGYTKSGGKWKDSQGNNVSFRILTPGGWTDWTLGVETAVDQLNSFGFNANLQTTGSYFSQISSPENWAFITNTWLHGGPTAHPYFSLLHQLHKPQQHHVTTNYPGYTEKYGGSSASIEIPEATPNSGKTTVDVTAQLNALSKAQTDSEEQKLVQDLAWVANQDLPRIPIMEKQLQQWLTTDDWNVPEPANEDPDANVRWAPTNLPRAGKMNYRG